MSASGDKFTAIIRCKNEGQWIGHAIQSVLDHLPGAEVLVIDNHSTDNSRDVVRMFEHMADVRVISLDEYSPGSALNFGVALASREITLSISAHCVITQFDTARALQLFGQHVGVFGKQMPVYRGKKLVPRYVWSNFGDEQVVDKWSDAEGRFFLHNGFAFYLTSTLLKRPFEAKWYTKEDRYWAQAMVSEGFSILYDPSFQCLHHWTPGGATWTGIG